MQEAIRRAENCDFLEAFVRERCVLDKNEIVSTNELSANAFAYVLRARGRQHYTVNEFFRLDSLYSTRNHDFPPPEWWMEKFGITIWSRYTSLYVCGICLKRPPSNAQDAAWTLVDKDRLERLERLERTVEELYHAPGMPGYETTGVHFKQLQEQREREAQRDTGSGSDNNSGGGKE